MTADGRRWAGPRLTSAPAAEHGNGPHLICPLSARTGITRNHQGHIFLATILRAITACTIHPASHDGLLPEGR